MLKKIVLFKLLKKHFKIIDALSLLLGIVYEKNVIKLPKIKRTIYLRKNTKDLETFEEIFLTNLYNINLPIIPKTIVDAGANVGLASLFFHLKYPEASIVALEIESKNLDCIRQNTSGIDRFELIGKGLFNRKSFFKIEDPYNASNSFQIREVNENENYDIESTTLDEILTQKNWETIDVLKIDIEGAEKELFSSNYENWLPKTKIIMIETHDRMIPKCSYTVMNTINKYNFILYTTTEGTLIYFNMSLVSIKI
jgi:FkbM family methyltransferase